MYLGISKLWQKSHKTMVSPHLLVAKMGKPNKRKVVIQMSKAMSTNQRLQLVSVLMLNTDFDKVPSDIAQNFIDDPTGSGSEFTKFLCNNGKIEVVVKNFPTWRTIKLGTGLKTADDFRKAIKQAGMKIGEWGNDILDQPAFTVASEKIEVELINVSVAELDFKNGATYKDICARAKELGLDLCPAEVGPQLRLQYKDQPKGEWLLVSMEAITDSDGSLHVFDVVHGDGALWLDGNGGNAGRFWSGDGRFLFLRRK